MGAKNRRKEAAAGGAVVSTDGEPLKLRLGCCSGIHFMEGADEQIGVPDRLSDCRTRNVCCKGRRIRFRDSEDCL